MGKVELKENRFFFFFNVCVFIQFRLVYTSLFIFSLKFIHFICINIWLAVALHNTNVKKFTRFKGKNYVKTKSICSIILICDLFELFVCVDWKLARWKSNTKIKCDSINETDNNQTIVTEPSHLEAAQHVRSKFYWNWRWMSHFEQWNKILRKES